MATLPVLKKVPLTSTGSGGRPARGRRPTPSPPAGPPPQDLAVADRGGPKLPNPMGGATVPAGQPSSRCSSRCLWSASSPKRSKGRLAARPAAAIGATLGRARVEVHAQPDQRQEQDQDEVGGLALLGPFPGPPRLADQVDGADDHRDPDRRAPTSSKEKILGPAICPVMCHSLLLSLLPSVITGRLPWSTARRSPALGVRASRRVRLTSGRRTLAKCLNGTDVAMR